MKVYVNSKEYELNSHTSVGDLSLMLELPSTGVAVAVNNKIIKRDDWSATELCENDNVIIIKAACGG